MSPTPVETSRAASVTGGTIAHAGALPCRRDRLRHDRTRAPPAPRSVPVGRARGGVRHYRTRRLEHRLRSATAPAVTTPTWPRCSRTTNSTSSTSSPRPRPTAISSRPALSSGHHVVCEKPMAVDERRHVPPARRRGGGPACARRVPQPPVQRPCDGDRPARGPLNSRRRP